MLHIIFNIFDIKIYIFSKMSGQYYHTILDRKCNSQSIKNLMIRQYQHLLVTIQSCLAWRSNL